MFGPHTIFGTKKLGRIRAPGHLSPGSMHWTSLSNDLMHLKRTHLVSAVSFFPNSISRSVQLSFAFHSRSLFLLIFSFSFPPNVVHRIPGRKIYTIMNTMTREMQISPEISRGMSHR